MKRIVLFICLLLITVGLLAQTAIPPSQGDGSANNPYQIATWQNLYWLSQNSTLRQKYFIQTADIDLSTTDPAITTWDNGAGWTPIGNNLYCSSGEYNGNGKTITGLFINRPNSSNQGLFESVDMYSKIINLGLLNVNIKGNNCVGALSGKLDSSTITNCYCTGTVSGINYCGGLVGRNDYATITDCYSNVSVHGTKNYYWWSRWCEL